MSSDGDLNSAQAQEIQEQLFTTHRSQISREVPVPLPRRDFWTKVRALLSHLDMEIQSMVRKGSIDMRLQNLQKRQTNIRRIASELARKRMVAMMQHAASQGLRSGVSPGIGHELPSLDWQRHDPAEKAFYHAVQKGLDRFKMDIDWTAMQQGMLGELIGRPQRHAPGTMQLDSYLPEGGSISPGPPPALAFEDDMPPLLEGDIDEEERLMGERDWMDEEAYMMADDPEAPPASPASTGPSASAVPHGRHAAAMELAPSSGRTQIADEPMLESQDNRGDLKPLPDEQPPAEVNDLVRVRVLESLPEPIVTEDGEELVLEAGDVHMMDRGLASWLTEAGVAEAAPI